jgi:CDP-diacylglycerol--glycerol-3-phosphate 3-phosphatidyltransferase
VPLNLPNVLTLLRVLAIPVLVVLFYLPGLWATLGTAALFLGAAITDWFDGYLARKHGLTTAFGAFLDPVADKLIVAVALVLLVDRYDAPWATLSACVIIGREIVVSALREWMAQVGQSAKVAVSGLAKTKTAMQMTAIVVLLLHTPTIALFSWLLYPGIFCLLVAVLLTLWSMVVYLKAFSGVLAEGQL